METSELRNHNEWVEWHQNGRHGDPPANPQYYSVRYKVWRRNHSTGENELFFNETFEVSTDPNALPSQAFMCPECGELWGRIYGHKSWSCTMRRCTDCGDGTLIAWDFPLEYYTLDYWPRDLLKYEVLTWQVPTELQQRDLPFSQVHALS